MIKCRNCEYGKILKITDYDRGTKVSTNIPCGLALCVRLGRKVRDKVPVNDTKKSCRHFKRRQEAEGQGDS